MAELKDILAEHKQHSIEASFDTDYKVILQCDYDCPACAQHKLVKWLEERLYKAVTYDNKAFWYIDGNDLFALHIGVGLEDMTTWWGFDSVELEPSGKQIRVVNNKIIYNPRSRSGNRSKTK